jgi:hypothetical protein
LTVTTTLDGVWPEPGFTESQFPPLDTLAVTVKLVAVLLKMEMLWGEGGLAPSLRAANERDVGATVKEVGVAALILPLYASDIDCCGLLLSVTVTE